MLKGTSIFLRALEPNDVELLYQWENDSSVWHLGNTLAPLSRQVLQDYINTAQQDIYSSKQLRLVICLPEKAIGCIDLFDFDAQHLKAGIGILIADKSERNKGYANEAIELIKEYAAGKLNLHQLYCSISISNTPSIKLFEALGFLKSGEFKDWIRVGGKYEAVNFYQCLL